jgi:hypothetical protein
MPRVPVLSRCALLVTLAAASGCSVTRRQADLLVQGDVPATDTRGRRLAPSARRAVGETLARQVTVGFSCRSDESCDPKVSAAPIASKLGRPPAPEQIAAEMAPRRPASEAARQDVRRAYDESVRTRYRLYADYLFGQLRGADWVQITPVRGDAAAQRYSGARIDDGLRESMREIADHYSALEWARFERTWNTAAARAPAARPSQAGAPAPADPAPDSPGPDASGAPPPAPTPAREAVIEEVPQPPPAKAPAPAPAPAPAAAAPVATDAPCRRSCSLDYRSCLAGCRTRPIAGGEYDDCAEACERSVTTCRAACTPSARR